VLGGRVGDLLISISITPILVRVLDSGGYGDYAFALSTIGILTIISDIGVFDGVRKYVGERGKGKKSLSVLVFYFKYTVTTAFSIFLIMLLGYHIWLYKYIPVSGELFFLVILLTVVSKQFFNFGRAAVMGLGNENYSEFVFVVRKLLFGVIGIGLAFYGLNAVGAILGQFLSFLICFIILLVFVAKIIDRDETPGRSENQDSAFNKKKLLEFNILNFFLVLCLHSLYHVDIILIRIFANAEVTGFYQAAITVSKFIWFVPIAIQTVLVQSSSKMWKENRERISTIATLSTRYSLIVTLLIAIGFSVSAKPLFEIYFGTEFTPAIIPFLVLVPGSLFFGLARPILAIGQGKGMIKPLLYATLGAALLNFILNLVLIPRYGMIGGAAATSLSYASMFFFHTYAAFRLDYNPIQEVRTIRILSAGIGAAILMIISANYVDSRLAVILIVAVVGTTSYCAFINIFGVLNENEKRKVQKNLTEIIKRL